MKFNSFLLLYFFSFSSIAQNSFDNPLLQSIIQFSQTKNSKSKIWLNRSVDYYQWDSIGDGNWDYKHSTIAMFDSSNALMMSITLDTTQNIFLHKDTFEYVKNKLIAHTNYVWQNIAWVSNTKTTHSFDIHNRDTSTIENIWEAGRWKSISGTKHKLIYRYDHKITEDITSTFNGNIWKYQQKKTYVFSDLFLSEYTDYNWLDSSNLWIPIQRLLYIPYPQSNDIQSLTIQTPMVNSWRDVLQFNYTYNGENSTIIIDTVENYLWKHLKKQTNSFDANHAIFESLTEKYLNGIWINSTKSKQTKDDFGNITEDLSEFWNQGNWRTSSQNNFYYTYNTDGLLTEKVCKKWNNQAQNSRFTEKFVFSNFLSAQNLIENMANTEKQFLVYPNPAKNYIYFDTNDIHPAWLIFTNITGKTLLSGRFSCQSPINISNWEKGIYFIQIVSDKQIETRKFFKE